MPKLQTSDLKLYFALLRASGAVHCNKNMNKPLSSEYSALPLQLFLTPTVYQYHVAVLRFQWLLLPGQNHQFWHVRDFWKEIYFVRQCRDG